MATIRCKDNWVHFNSHENQCFEEEEEEETLSLCDLPTTNNQNNDTNSNKQEDNNQEDFEFGFVYNAAACTSPEIMCSAEEVFFEGQILPLRHSVSSATTTATAGATRKINRSASMSVVGSRSGIRNDPKMNRKHRIRNQFHSHPSPSPQIRTQSFRTLSHSNPKNSSLWSFLQVGLLKPQEIGLSDLKNRSKRFGSHNSNSSSNSNRSSSTIINSTTDQSQSQSQSQNRKQNQNQNQNQNRIHQKNGKKVKKKQRLFFSGCKCSVDSIESTVEEKSLKKKMMTKEKEEKIVEVSEESKMIGERKQTVTRHRTFEWLKQLSIAATTAG